MRFLLGQAIILPDGSSGVFVRNAIGAKNNSMSIVFRGTVRKPESGTFIVDKKQLDKANKGEITIGG